MKIAVFLFAALLAAVSVQATIYSAGRNAVEDGWVIRFHPETEVGVRARHFSHPLLANANIVREYNFNKGRFQAYAVTGIDADTAVALHALPEVMDISPNIQVRLFDQDLEFHAAEANAQACERHVSKSWGLSRTVHWGRLPTQPIENMPYELDTQACGRGIELHVFDTGVAEHNDFRGRRVVGADGTGEGPGDFHGHGTHVAGSAAGATYGLARCAQIVEVKVLNREGAGSLFSILAGIEYTAGEAEKGKKIVANFSLGALRNDLLNGIVTNLVESGVVVTAAAGNSNEDATFFSPASAKGVLTVAASTKTDARSEFSNWGPIVDLFAPGSLITGPWIGAPDAERTVSGTSMACPHAAGVAVKVWAQNPRFTNEQVMERVIRLTNPDVITDTRDTPNRLLFHSCQSK